MSNAALGDDNSNSNPTKEQFTRNSPGSYQACRARSQPEQRQKLKAVCLSSQISDNPAATRGSRLAKENVNKNHFMSPSLLMDSKEDANAEERGEVANAATKSVVTPSPKPDESTSRVKSDDEIGDDDDAEESEPPAERAARRARHPLTDIMEPGPNDCLFGRGGRTNHHPGNKLYRKMVEEKKGKYRESKRLDKPLVAMEIINEWRALNPPGRFLKQDEYTKLWNDVGDKMAREKTSQALREKLPVTQRDEEGDHDRHKGASERSARFEQVTRSPVGRRVKRSNLARDHSLGEAATGPEEISLEGFSWDGPEGAEVRNADANVLGEQHPTSHRPYRHFPRGKHHPPHYPSCEHQYPQGEYPQGEYPQGEYPQGEYHQGEYHQGEHPRVDYPHGEYSYEEYSHGEYPHGEYTHGEYPRGEYPHGEYPHGEHPRGEHPHAEHPYVRDHCPSNNSPPDATSSHPAPYAFGERPPPPYYGHHHPGYGPPPPPYRGHAPPPYHPNPHYSSSNHEHYYQHSPHPSSHQRPREHSLQMNPFKGATTSQPALGSFNERDSHASYNVRPLTPPLPSSQYDGHTPSPYYGAGYRATSPRHAWPAPPPQFSYHPGSNPSAFGRYDSSSRSDSLRSLGSSVDAFYDRHDGRYDSSGASSAGRSPSRDSVAGSAEHPSAVGTSQDYSKIAELIRDSSDRTSAGLERSNSWNGSNSASVKGDDEYGDTIQGSKSMPHDDSGTVTGSPRRPVAGSPSRLESATKKGEELKPNSRKPSLIRKLSGGVVARGKALAPPHGILCPEPGRGVAVCRPEPVKRDTSNQPETLETKRSIKRAVLSRDQSAAARRLKEEQIASPTQRTGSRGTCTGGRPPPESSASSRVSSGDRPVLGTRASSRLSKAEMLDRKLSVEIDKLGLEDTNKKDKDTPSLGRMTTGDVLASLMDDGDLGLGLVNESDEIAQTASQESADVDADVAEKWLKDEA